MHEDVVAVEPFESEQSLSSAYDILQCRYHVQTCTMHNIGTCGKAERDLIHINPQQLCRYSISEAGNRQVSRYSTSHIECDFDYLSARMLDINVI